MFLLILLQCCTINILPMIQSVKISQPDLLGATASSLCLIHCAATPFLFVAKTCSATCCSAAPLWWKFIDYLFIVISFIAIYYTSRSSTKNWVKVALWGNWALLAILILSESFAPGFFPESLIYFPAVAIIGLHYYNLKYCKCADEACCTAAVRPE